jgi:hypothetical protein
MLPEEILSGVLLVRSPEELVLPPLKVLLVVSLLPEGLVSGVLLVVSLLPEGLLSVVASPFPPPPLEPPLSAEPPPLRHHRSRCPQDRRFWLGHRPPSSGFGLSLRA